MADTVEDAVDTVLSYLEPYFHRGDALSNLE
jgi:hypothetical protein